MSPKSDTSLVKSVCRMCASGCGINAHLADGKLVGVSAMKEHPIHRLCVKASAIADWMYSPQRITRPLKKVNGAWQETSWDDALGVIAEKLGGLKARHGARSLVVHLGEPTVGTNAPEMAVRFCSLFGTPNFTTGASLCFAAKGIGHGLSINRRMFPMSSNYRGTNCIVVWGHNPGQSRVGEEADILAAQKRGAKLIVVDPRATALAKKTDLYIQIKPGTDGALALALINVIIAEGLYDKAFVERWTYGFDKLKERAGDYGPEAVAAVTGVPAAEIRRFARIYAGARPAVISQGVALDHCVNGVQNSRAVAVLVAITGNLDVSGGNTYYPPVRRSSLRVKGKVALDEVIGADYPIFNKFVSETTAMPVADAILSGRPYPVKALIIQGCNPMLTWPDSRKVKQAFEQLELLVVSDLFMNETAEMADIFLPAAAFPERRDIVDYRIEGLPMVTLNNKVVEPPSECREDWRVWAGLGGKMGYADYFPWQNTDELLAYLLQPSGITLEQLERNPAGVFYGDPERQRRYEEEGFETPTGKVEIFSTALADHGYEPLPTFTLPEETTADYPLVLTTGSRTIAYNASQHRHIARLGKLDPEPLAEVHPEAAAELDIADGEAVTLETARGGISLKAKVTPDIHPRAVSLPYGWAEANANILTDYEPHDPISGYPVFKAIPCRVRKIGE